MVPIVGDDECPYDEIIDIIKNSPLYNVFLTGRRWITIARAIGVSAKILNTARTRYLSQSVPVIDVFKEILTSWRVEQGNGAKLTLLIAAFETSGLTDLAHSLRARFGMTSSG